MLGYSIDLAPIFSFAAWNSSTAFSEFTVHENDILRISHHIAWYRSSIVFCHIQLQLHLWKPCLVRAGPAPCHKTPWSLRGSIQGCSYSQSLGWSFLGRHCKYGSVLGIMVACYQALLATLAGPFCIKTGLIFLCHQLVGTANVMILSAFLLRS